MEWNLEKREESRLFHCPSLETFKPSVRITILALSGFHSLGIDTRHLDTEEAFGAPGTPESQRLGDPTSRQRPRNFRWFLRIDLLDL